MDMAEALGCNLVTIWPGQDGYVGGIAIWAHIGGFVFGLLFGLPWVRNRTDQDFR